MNDDGFNGCGIVGCCVAPFLDSESVTGWVDGMGHPVPAPTRQSYDANGNYISTCRECGE